MVLAHLTTGTPPVGVVVCTYRGRGRIAATLDHLDALDPRPEAIVVVDDGSADGTAEYCRDRGFDVVVHAHNRGLAAARNTGWRHLDTPFVAFTDDDCEPAPDWVGRLWEACRAHPEAAAWGGPAVATGGETGLGRYLLDRDPLAPLERDLLVAGGPVYRFARYLARSAQEPPTGGRAVASIAGANMMIARAALEEQDGFDERFRFGGEEEQLFERLTSGGAVVWFDPAARVGHRFEETWGDLLRRSRAYGRGNARRWALRPGSTPTLYPAPVLVAGALAVATRRAGALVPAALLPLALFSRWTRRAARSGDARYLAYPYLQLLEEAANDLGWVDFVRRERGLLRRGRSS